MGDYFTIRSILRYHEPAGSFNAWYSLLCTSKSLDQSTANPPLIASTELNCEVIAQISRDFLAENGSI